MRNISNKTVEKNTAALIAVYSEAYLKLFEILHKGLSYETNPNFSQMSMYSIMKQVEKLLNDLGVDVLTLVQEHTLDAVERGYLDSVIGFLGAEGLTGAALTTAVLTFPFSRVGKDLAEQFAKDTFKDLLNANKNVEASVQKLVRETFSKHMAVQAALNQSYDNIAKEILKDLSGKKLKTDIANGIISIVDKAGRRWKLGTYVDMVVKTKYQQARIEGMKEFTRETGTMDLAQIPKNGAKDMCRIYEGLVISLTGATAGFQTFDDLQATNQIFHPRCRHTPVPIKSLDHLHPNEREFAEMLNSEMKDYLKSEK